MKQMHCRLGLLMAIKDVKLTQRRVSQETGLGASTIGRLFNNTFDRVDRSTVETLCDYFECEVGDLFELVKECDDVR